MEMKGRLFDCVEYQLTHFPKEDMLVAKENGVWKGYSTIQVKEMADNLSAGLLELGISGNNMTAEGADKIGIISNNRPEWIITDIAVQQIGAILIPIYPTTSSIEIAFILNEAEVKYMFVGDEALFNKINDIKHNIPSVKGIYSFSPVNNVSNWKEILSLETTENKEKVQILKSKIPTSHTATIIYTSGTTGTPKGVMLSHDSIYANVRISKDSFPFEDRPDWKVLSFLPLNHILERMVTYIYLFSGNSIYYAESLDTIGDNLREVKPNGFTTVPRLLEKVFEKIIQKGNELKGIKRRIFFWSVSVAGKYDNQVKNNLLYNLQLAVANKLVFAKWREALGGHVSFIVTGGAACQQKLLRIFNAANIPVYEGYGPTENSPVVCVNRKTPKYHKFGTVGPPLNEIEVKIAADGELLVNGPCIMQGYYKQPDLTAKTIINGWLHTGDIGVWDKGNIKITDRKKELFKTSGGKYVAPQPIENKFKESPFIEQMMVIGADQKFVAALIIPSFSTLKEWLSDKNISFETNHKVISNPIVLSHFEDIIKEYNTHFNQVEQIKKFILLPDEWGIETGEMTPKLSLRRKVVTEKFSVEINSIYK